MQLISYIYFLSFIASIFGSPGATHAPTATCFNRVGDINLIGITQITDEIAFYINEHAGVSVPFNSPVSESKTFTSIGMINLGTGVVEDLSQSMVSTASSAIWHQCYGGGLVDFTLAPDYQGFCQQQSPPMSLLGWTRLHGTAVYICYRLP